MLLYELAIVLDQRSTDVVAAAAELGLGELQTAADLDAHQVAVLKAHFGGPGVPPPLAPLSPGAPPLPPPPGASTPVAPASWGPPAAPAGRTAAKRARSAPPPTAAPPAPTAPHVPPAPPVPPAAAPSAAPGPSAPATWGPPAAAAPPPDPSASSALAAWATSPAPPTPPSPPSPSVGASAAGPAMWGPPPGAAPPPPGGPAADGHTGPRFAYPEAASAPGPLAVPGPAAVSPPPPPPPVAAAAPPPAPGGGPSTGQKVLIGAVVAAVLALFAFMALNTGPDKERERAIAAQQAQLEADLETDLATTTKPSAATTEPEGPATTAPAPATTAAPGSSTPVDVERFCQGGLAVATFELRLAAAITDEDFAELTGLVRDRRAGWTEDVRTMSAGAAPDLVDDIGVYQRGYDQFFDAISSSGSLAEAYGKVDRRALARSSDAAHEVGAQITSECA